MEKRQKLIATIFIILMAFSGKKNAVLLQNGKYYFIMRAKPNNYLI
jgi:hypothetical protein